MEKQQKSDPIRSLRELGIYLDENGCLHELKDNSLITMKTLTADPILTMATITQYVQMKMIQDYSFEEIRIPLSIDCQDCVHSSIFGTKGCLVSQTLLVIIPSSGTYPGIWSRSLCIDEGLLKGSMLPFFHKAMQGNMGIIVLNPNVNNYKVVDANGNTTSTPIPYNSTPDKHVLYCWDRIISRTTARNIVIMAYGQGGVYAKTLIQERESEILCKLRAMALTESAHILISDLNFGLNMVDSKGTRTFLENHTLNWIVSDLPIGQRDSEMEERLGCICISGVSSVQNPGILNSIVMDDILTFFYASCSNSNLLTEKYWEDHFSKKGVVIHPHSNSDELKTNNEVLVTNLPLSSNWIADKMIEECQVCLIPFSFLVRKHHCRSCGRVVCGMCSKYKMIFNNRETAYRVCCSCYFEYKRDLHPTSGLIDQPSTPTALSKDDFQLLRVIGRGSFGKVLLVRGKRDKRVYALKILLKSQVIARNQVEHTQSERRILEEMKHPFLCPLEFAFQTDDKLYLGMPFLAGGPLFYHLQQCRYFSEDRARFYCAEVILGIGFLHSHNILYRDMKPENLLLDLDGHCIITDFGLSKQGNDPSATAQTICGTPEYVAPEVLEGKPYGRAVDWWSVGTLLYEMIAGYPPFYDKNRKIMFSKILSAKLRFSSIFSIQACNLISRLLDRNPEKRLGSSERDAKEIMEHPFFKDMDWEALEQRQIQPPWKPALSSETDTTYFNHKYTYAEIDESSSSDLTNSNLPSFPKFTYTNIRK